MPDDRPIDGVNLLPFISGKKKRRESPMYFCFVKASKKARAGSPPLAVIDNNLKLLTYLSDDTETDMLFDLDKDLFEENNIASQYPAKVKEMRAGLAGWLVSCKRSHSGADYPTDFTAVNEFPEIN
jgi:hypothetical protein